MRSFSSLSLIPFLLSSAVFASPSGHVKVHSHQHHALAKKHATPAEIVGRQSNGALFTWFNVGLGACGSVNVASDFIVALNEFQWDNGAHCGQQISIRINGKISTATIMDLCPFGSCQPGQLDFSRGLFLNWNNNPEQTGVLNGDWWFGTDGGNGGNGGGQQQTTTAAPDPPATTEAPPPATQAPPPPSTEAPPPPSTEAPPPSSTEAPPPSSTEAPPPPSSTPLTVEATTIYSSSSSESTPITHAAFAPESISSAAAFTGSYRFTSQSPEYQTQGKARGCITAQNSFDGSPVVIQNCDSTPESNETWNVALDSTGLVQIFQDKCLDVTGGADVAGTLLQVWTCDATNPNQQWSYDNTTQKLTWHGGAGNKCLDLTNSNITDGSQLQLWDCVENNDNQRFTWSTVRVEKFPSKIQPRTGDLCLAPQSDTNGAQIAVADCNADVFKLWGVPENSFFGPIHSVNGTQKCLDVPDGNTTNGNPLQVWDCVEGNANQQWIYGDDASLHIRLVGQDKCADAGDLSMGNILTISDCVFVADSQRWFVNGIPSSQ